MKISGFKRRPNEGAQRTREVGAIPKAWLRGLSDRDRTAKRSWPRGLSVKLRVSAGNFFFRNEIFSNEKRHKPKTKTDRNARRTRAQEKRSDMKRSHNDSCSFSYAGNLECLVPQCFCIPCETNFLVTHKKQSSLSAPKSTLIFLRKFLSRTDH